MTKIYNDQVCQALAETYSAQTVYETLNAFLSQYDQLDTVYAELPEGVSFTSESEMVEFFVKHPGAGQSFYWNGTGNEYDNPMVGANVTPDKHLIMSVTLDGTEADADQCLMQLKQIIGAKIGVISSPFPAEYSSGEDFKQRYGECLL